MSAMNQVALAARCWGRGHQLDEQSKAQSHGQEAGHAKEDTFQG